MKIATHPAQLRRIRGPVVLAAGFFDGVHRGHHRVLRRTVARARRLHGQAWALTFDTHPLKILKPLLAPSLLTSRAHKLRLLANRGLDGCLVMPFTRRLAMVRPDTFIRGLKRAVPSLRQVFVGTDWHFGRRGAGDVRLLRQMGETLGFGVGGVACVRYRGRAISSTRIRNEIVRGRLAAAASMLGRPYSILGTVTHGRSVGRRLGFPTANLDVHNEALPPPGVYAGCARVNGRVLPGVLNLGWRPTFGLRQGRRMTVELHLIGFSGNLYGREVEVFLVRKLRPERRFSSPAALARRIAADIVETRRILKSKKIRCNALARRI